MPAVPIWGGLGIGAGDVTAYDGPGADLSWAPK
jgi:hypothetical protein